MLKRKYVMTSVLLTCLIEAHDILSATEQYLNGFL